MKGICSPFHTTGLATDRRRCILPTTIFLACAAAALTLTSRNVRAQNAFLRFDLVSDIPGLAANTDTNLVNPWGIALSDTSPFWVADNARGLSTLYDGSGAPQSLVVTIPSRGGGSGPSIPTGVAFNAGSSFQIAPGKPARVIFATAGGTIAAWSPAVDATHALLVVDRSASAAIYEGLAIGTTASGDFLYAANFQSGSIEVFNSNFAPATLAGIQGKLLVGNSGHGRIHAFDPTNGVLLDVLRDGGGSPLQIVGLRGLVFGKQGTAGNRDTLYFTAGFAGFGSIGDHGLFGSPAQRAPLLSIESIQPGSVRLLWPTNDPLFGLQFSTNLSFTNWTPAQPPPVLIGPRYVVTNPASGVQRIYQLRKP